MIALLQWPGIFLTVCSEDFDLGDQYGQELLAPGWPDDLSLGEGEKAPPKGYWLWWEEESGI